MADRHAEIAKFKGVTVMTVHADDRVFCRSAAGEMVQVRLSVADVERLKQCPDGTEGMVWALQVLCEVVARELPLVLPS